MSKKAETFEKMLEILSDADQKKKAREEYKNNIYLKEQLLVTLEYMREYL